MKLKRQPEDFRVVELSDFAPTAGSFALYRLSKRGLGTPEAVASIARRWQLPARVISFGGLKDRHAVTEQFLTIEHGPRRGLEQESLRLEYLGQAARAFQPSDISGNRFEIVLRAMAPESRAAVDAVAEQLLRDGVPNYFDEQRFGSLGESGEFVARAWCAGNWERTIWLAVADTNLRDTPRSRELKQLVQAHWGDWRHLLALVGAPQSRADEELIGVLRHLAARPTDFRGAVTRLDVQLRGLYLSSFQSHLWNRLLAAQVRECCPPDRLAAVNIGPDHVWFFTALEAAERARLAELELPLPSARQHLEAGTLADLVDRSLAESGLQMRELRVKYPRDSFFAKGWRRAIVRPAEWQAAWQPDDLHPGHSQLLLQFELPRGSYATIVVKRLTEVPH